MFKPLVTSIIFLFFSASCSNTVVKHSQHDEMYSPSMGKPMAYSVYTPPNWSPSESLPLMVLLHGARDNHTTFDRYAIGQLLDQQISAGLLPRVIIVNPDGELGFWENWHDGSHHYRDWVLKDLMPHIAQRYNTGACPENCYVTGISMGAHGAMRFAYYQPETFNSVAAISGQIISRQYPGKNSLRKTILKWFLPIERIWGDIDADSSHVPKDLDPYISWIEKPTLREMPLFLAWGNKDYGDIVESNERFRSHLDANSRPYDWLVYDGGHKWVYWRDVIAESIRFHHSAAKTSDVANKQDTDHTPDI